MYNEVERAKQIAAQGHPVDNAIRNIGNVSKEDIALAQEIAAKGHPVDNAIKDRFGFGTEVQPPKVKASDGAQNIQGFIQAVYQEEQINATIPQVSIKGNKVFVELGNPPADENEYIEWLRGAETVARNGVGDIGGLLQDMGVKGSTLSAWSGGTGDPNTIFTINGKPIQPRKGFLGTKFLEGEYPDFAGLNTANITI